MKVLILFITGWLCIGFSAIAQYKGGNGRGDATGIRTGTLLNGSLLPTITSFTPTAGCTGVTTVTITGTSFSGTSAVSIGGVAVNSFTVNSATEISALVGSGSTGVIQLTTPAGSAQSTGIFSVNPTWYLDADGDGYAAVGEGATQLVCESPGAAWTLSSLGADCDDSNPNINSGATEICGDMADDNCDGNLDEYCPGQSLNDSPAMAVNLQYSVNVTYPNCFPIQGYLTGATDSPESAVYNGKDLWYKFTAQSTAVSITLSSSTHDDFIALYGYTGSNYLLLATENASSGINDMERLNYEGLTPGNIYYVSVGVVSGNVGAGFSLCIQHLMPSGCATAVPVGGLNLCNSYRAVYRGAPSQGVTYSFNFTPTGATGGSPTSVSGTNGLIVLSNPTLALRYGGTYSVVVNALYNLLNSAGTAEPITVTGTAAGLCSNVSIIAAPQYQVRASQICPASLLRSNWLIGDRITIPLCGVQNFTYEFTQIVGCSDGSTVGLPVEYTTAGATPYLQMGVLPNLSSTGVWSVRIRPNFAYGSGTYGPARRIQVLNTSASGMLPEGSMDSEERIAWLNEEGMLIYPNPGMGEFINIFLSGLNKGNLDIRVLDAAGRLVTSRTYAVEESLQTSLVFDQTLSAGVYMIEMLNEGTQRMERLIVQ